MKFCPECGSNLGIGSVKFCANCGKNLWQTSPNTATPYPSSPKMSLSDNTIYQDIAAAGEETKIEQGQDFASTTASSAASTNTVYSLGVKLEELVEKILKNKDYTTQRRQKLRGRS